jgi:hypothetical protein
MGPPVKPEDDKQEKTNMDGRDEPGHDDLNE